MPLLSRPMPSPSGGASPLAGRVVRKRWRYVGLYDAELMLCAAVVGIGPFRHSFWSVWDRRRDRHLEHTRLRPGRPEVRMDSDRVEISAADLKASLRIGPGEPVEVVCPSRSGPGWGWTEKRAGVPIAAALELDGETLRIEGHGVDDRSAGYHARHTAWSWSAGVGEDSRGRRLAWNLTEGINDPPESSERTIWVDGVPAELGPAAFDGLDAVDLGEDGRLGFEPGPERAREDDFLIVRSDYRHRFGEFSGRIGGHELSGGLGVMERHVAVW